LLALRESLRVRRGARRRREAGQVGHARHQVDPPRAHAAYVLPELRSPMKLEKRTVQRKNEHGGSDGVCVLLFTRT
jgi:hypothetical protein